MQVIPSRITMQPERLTLRRQGRYMCDFFVRAMPSDWCCVNITMQSERLTLRRRGRCMCDFVERAMPSDRCRVEQNTRHGSGGRWRHSQNRHHTVKAAIGLYQHGSGLLWELLIAWSASGSPTCRGGNVTYRYGRIQHCSASS